MASRPQVSKTLNSRAITDIMNHLNRPPSNRLRPLPQKIEPEDEEIKRPASNHSSEGFSRAPSEKMIIRPPPPQDDDAMSVHSTGSRMTESRRSQGPRPYKLPPSVQVADQRAERITANLDGKCY